VRGAIVGGAPSDDASVVVLRAETGGREIICSATAIADRVALTAAHCLDPALVGDGARFSVYSGAVLPSPLSASSLIAVREAIRHPAYQLATATAGNDIGVVVTASPIGAPPRELNRRAVDDQAGASARLVGYGVVDATDAGEATLGTRREVTTTVGRVDAKRLWFLDGAKNSCTGDSGGPALMTLDGEIVVAGVISFGDEACQMYGTATRVDVHADAFVQPILDRVAAEPVVEGGAGGRPMGGGCAVAGDAPVGPLVVVGMLLLSAAARRSSGHRHARSARARARPTDRAPRPRLRPPASRAA
jgi:secreted trypsin-like serine protease